MRKDRAVVVSVVNMMLRHCLLLISGAWFVNAEINGASGAVANAGDQVHLPCTSAANFTVVSWKYHSQASSKTGRIVSHNGLVYDTFRPRFTQMVNGTLVISNVRTTDVGYYECLGRNGWELLDRVFLHIVEAATITPQRRNSLLPFVDKQEENGSTRTPDISVSTDNRMIAVAVVLPCLVLIALVLSLIVIIISKGRRRLCFTEDGMNAPGADGYNENVQRPLRQPDYSSPITLCTAGNDRLVATAMSDELIMLLTENCCKIRVFSLFDYSNELETIDIVGMNPQDIVFCTVTGRFFLADKRPMAEGGFVWSISGKRKVKKWLPASKSSARNINPNSLSVRSGRLLVISTNTDLLLYGAERREMRHLRFPGVQIIHAAETTNDQFVVCFWDPETKIVLMDTNGNSIRTYEGDAKDLIRPYYVIVCRDSRVIISDSGNDRIIILDTELRYVDEFTHVGMVLKYPWQICFHEQFRKMIIVCRERCAILCENVSLDMDN